MKTLISNWIHAHLEYVTGGVSGLAVIAIDVPNLILKLVLAVVLGFLGALGAGIWKWLEKKLKKK